jgi:hypothetical protein
MCIYFHKSKLMNRQAQCLHDSGKEAAQCGKANDAENENSEK